MKIAVGIPCYNCMSQIGRNLIELDSVISNQQEIKAVFIIDNKSNDQTLTEVRTVISELKNSSLFQVYRNYENIGLGGTHKIAFTLAKEQNMSHLMILHGDHQATPQDIPLLIKAASIDHEATILGSRFKDQKLLKGYSFIRRTGNLALNAIYSFVCRTKITDLGSGLNLFNLKDFKDEDYQNFDNGFTFNMDLLLYLIKNKFKFGYVAIHWSTTDQISNAKSLQVGLKTLKKLFTWLMNKPLVNLPHNKTEEII